jgi:hypothetical protein
MGRIFAGVFLLLLLPLSAAAQEYPKAEVFGGYSYFKANTDGVGLNGWNASVAGNLTSWFGIEGDFSGSYGAPGVFGFSVPFVDVNSHRFMVGPKVSYRSRAATPFAHFLIGAARAGTSSFGYSISDSTLATAVGGGIDINLSKSIVFRAVQADYLMTRFNAAPQVFLSGLNGRQNNFRVSTGLVIRLGN